MRIEGTVIVTGAPVRRVTDRFVDLSTLDPRRALDGEALTAVVRELMTPDTASEGSSAPFSGSCASASVSAQVAHPAASAPGGR